MTVLLAAAPKEMGFLPLALLGGLICTGAEYAVHLFYDKVLGVQFWDYTAMKGHIQGRICPQFTALWGLLSAAAVKLVQPWVRLLAVPPWTAFLLWIVLAADSVLSWSLLRRYRDTELLSLRAVLAQSRASSQSSTSL